VKLNIEELNNLDLSNSLKYANGSSDIDYLAPAGRAHYRLLTHISNTFNNKKIIDIGTHYGWSALSLSSNKTNKVLTYDLENFLKNISPSILEIKNITFRQKNILEDKEELKNTDIIFLDVDPHDGIQEKIIYNFLIENNFNGILILDDIKLNTRMIEFWDSITHDKEDITEYGHYSGTGLVYFNR